MVKMNEDNNRKIIDTISTEAASGGIVQRAPTSDLSDEERLLIEDFRRNKSNNLQYFTEGGN